MKEISLHLIITQPTGTYLRKAGFILYTIFTHSLTSSELLYDMMILKKISCEKADSSHQSSRTCVLYVSPLFFPLEL